MANKKISEFPVTTSLAGNDSFLINHLGSTSTIAFSALSAAISTIVNTFIPTQVYDSVPIGSVHFFATSAAPTGYLECDGSVISKSTYNDLYLVIKDTFSSPVSANHFRLPDLRGEFIRGWDDGRGVDSGRGFGSSQSDEFKNHIHSLDRVLTWPSRTGIPAVTEQEQSGNPDNYSGYSLSSLSAGGFETRPRNVALLPCIKSQNQLINLQ